MENQNKNIIFVSRNNNKNKSNMDYNKKLEMLAKEFDAATQYASKALNDFIDTAIEKAMVEAFNELTPDEQMALILGLLCEMVEDSITKELTAVAEAIEKETQEKEMRRYEEKYREEFLTELEMLSGIHRRVVTPEPEQTDVPDVLNHLEKLGVKF